MKARLAFVAAAAILAWHGSSSSQEHSGHPLGAFEYQPADSDVVVAAPHGSYDRNTPPIAMEVARLLGAGYVTTLRFVVDKVRINVNRPTEGAHLICAQETRTERAQEVYAAYRGLVIAAARKPLQLYLEIHGNSRPESSGQIELATTGVSVDEARRVKDAYASSLARLRKKAPEFPDLALLVEPLDRVYFTAGCTKRFGMLNREVAARTLHFEFPRGARTDALRNGISILVSDIVKALAND